MAPHTQAQGGDGAPTAAMRFRIKAAPCVLERGRLPSTGCDPGRLSTRTCVAALLSRCFPGVRFWTATLAAPLHMGGSAQPGRDVPQSACAYSSHAIRYIHRHRIERLLPHALESSPYVRLQSCRFQCDDKWPQL